MKVLSLNTWGGKAGPDELISFLKNQSDIDIFCLQEVWKGGRDVIESWNVVEGMDDELFVKIQTALPSYKSYFRPHFKEVFGLAIFIKDTYEVIAEGSLYIYKEAGFVSGEDQGDHARILQYVTVETDAGVRTIVNVHGIWQPMSQEENDLYGGKRDNVDRIEQSTRIVTFLGTLNNPYVLLGDFNLLPNTESIAMIERIGTRNLIKEYGITSTRTIHFKWKTKFADYVFVHEEVEVKDFKVLSDSVSDHSPLYLDFV